MNVKDYVDSLWYVIYFFFSFNRVHYSNVDCHVIVDKKNENEFCHHKMRHKYYRVDNIFKNTIQWQLSFLKTITWSKTQRNLAENLIVLIENLHFVAW